MKTLAIILVLTNFAAAQDQYKPIPMTKDMQQYANCTDQFKELPGLAKRLGIAPTHKSSTMVLSMCDGRSYDLIELINALLDKMDRAERK